MHYLDWEFDWQIKRHEVLVDFNDSRAQRHLAALVRRAGSTTEGIVNDFVLGTTDSLNAYPSVQDAWEKLDSEQRDYVLAFRNLMSKPVLGHPENFPHLVYVEVIHSKYLDLLTEHEDEHGEGSLSVEGKEQLAVQAKRIIDSSIRSENKASPWVIRSEEEL